MPEASEPHAREALSEALVDEGDRLYGLALRITRDPSLAQDAVQEAFAAALTKADSFRGEAAASTWLYRIVYTKAIDLLRRRNREAGLEDDGELGADDVILEGKGSWNRPADELLLSRETHEALEQALQLLTPTQRAVFELRQMEERTTEEVGRLLRLPPGTVRVHLHRARLRLREALAGHFQRATA